MNEIIHGRLDNQVPRLKLGKTSRLTEAEENDEVSSAIRVSFMFAVVSGETLKANNIKSTMIQSRGKVVLDETDNPSISFKLLSEKSSMESKWWCNCASAFPQLSASRFYLHNLQPHIKPFAMCPKDICKASSKIACFAQ